MGSIQRVDRASPWRAVYRDHSGRQRSRSFKRKVDAERWLRDEMVRLDRGLWIDPSAGRILFSESSEQWLKGLDVRPKTRLGYQSLLKSRVLPTFGDYQLRQIRPAAVREWVADMQAEGLSAARIRQARQVLHAVLRQAVDDGLIATNPATRVKAPTVRPRRQRILTASQVEVLARAAERREHQRIEKWSNRSVASDAVRSGALIRFLAWSGLRWGEATALRWENVDTDRSRVTVDELHGSASELAGRIVFGPPKTHEARTVVVPAAVLAGLGDPGHRDALVFTAPRRGPLRGSNWRRDIWRPSVLAAKGIPDDLIPHDLRDTAASLAISAGASIKAVQRQLGHASAKMTLDVYGSLYEDDLDQLAIALEVRYARSGVARATRKSGRRNPRKGRGREGAAPTNGDTP